MNNVAFALQSSIGTQYVPSRILIFSKLYWEYNYCLPSHKYSNKDMLMSPYKYWMNLKFTPIKTLYIMQYCYDMLCYTQRDHIQGQSLFDRL